MGRMVLRGLLTRTGLPPDQLDRVVMGTVIQDVQTSNVAREAALAAGIPNDVPAFTVTMACISSNQALTSGVDLIRAGLADRIIAGGAETLSDPPIRVARPVRKRLFEARHAKGAVDYFELLEGLDPREIIPEAPSIEEFSTGEVMGESADRLAAAFGISRRAQDEFALRSHRKAAAARDAGRLDAGLYKAAVPPDFDPITTDNVIRDDTSLEQLRDLPPARCKRAERETARRMRSFMSGSLSSISRSSVFCSSLEDGRRYSERRFGRQRRTPQPHSDTVVVFLPYALPLCRSAALPLGRFAASLLIRTTPARPETAAPGRSHTRHGRRHSRCRSAGRHPCRPPRPPGPPD